MQSFEARCLWTTCLARQLTSLCFSVLTKRGRTVTARSLSRADVGHCTGTVSRVNPETTEKSVNSSFGP